MKLYNSVGPNPKVVRMFMAELGLTMDTIEVDLMGAENRKDAYMSINPAGQCPALEKDDGNIITEITVICEYLDDCEGNTDLIGSSPDDRAVTRMWTRRVDLNIVEPLTNGFRFSEGLALFKDRVRTMPDAAADLKTLAQERITWLDGLLGNKDYLCGDRFSLADILLFCFLEFGAQVGQPINTENSNIVSWYERVKSRPSASV
ncbi:MAG: glutathione S-transferase [Candidatus Azotimanducaceae bacterium]|jgi:glutathione S-transferase